MMDNDKHFLLEDRREVADGTTAFWFKTPKDFSFIAGQWVDVTLIDPKYRDDGGTARTFSIANSPHHTGKLMIVMRDGKSAFKRSLRELAIGSEIKLSGIGGSFVLPPLEVGRPKVAEAPRLHARATSNGVPEKSDKQIIMIAGGIGVAPMRGMVEWATQEHAPHKITLFYSNRTVGEAAFLNELSGWESKNFTVVTTVTEGYDPQWSGERGRIDEAMLKRHVTDITDARYYIAGPPAMVASTWQMLLGMGVDDSAIKTEEFSGY